MNGMIMKAIVIVIYRKGHLKAVVEANVTGIELVANLYDNQFFSTDFLAIIQSVCFYLKFTLLSVILMNE